MRKQKSCGESGPQKRPVRFFRRIIITLVALIVISSTPYAVHAADTDINVWWPAPNAQVTGVQPFKAVLSGSSPSDYTMYWQVDNGQLNQMSDSAVDYPHKEVPVDLSSWHWNASGTYTITFVAVDKNGSIRARKQVPIVVHTPQTTSVTSSTIPSSVSVVPTVSSPSTSSTITQKLYVDAGSRAASQAQEWRQSRPADAALMDVLARNSTAVWLGGWNANVRSDVDTIVTKAQQSGSAPVFVAYNIPGRDCGGYSAGGAAPNQYIQWIQDVANGIGTRDAIVVLEPDALASISCLSGTAASERISLLSNAISVLKAQPHTKVYVDAGHAGWIDPNTMAGLLRQVQVSRADGFSLNVSNYGWTQNEVSYGQSISQALGGSTHFVIDTSRNGAGPDGSNTWCNPSGRAIGTPPTLSTGVPLVDGYLWLKTPGESDGTCNGGPSAGTWWPDYALGLVRNSSVR